MKHLILTNFHCPQSSRLLLDESDSVDVSPSLVHRLERSKVYDILDLAEKAGVQLASQAIPELSLATILDVFDNEFYLAHLLSDPVFVILNGHRRTACPAPDESERYLALVCAEALLHADSSRIRSRIKSLLQGMEMSHVRESYDTAG